VVRARRAGGDVFLQKPIAPQDLLAHVDRLLSGAPAPEPSPAAVS
jgi:DNA-binding response OmpR family regulator